MTAGVTEEAVVAGGARQPPPCENCGTPLVGAFCHACGQHAAHHLRSVRAFVGHLLQDLAHYDSRALRTVVTLVRHPGRLTAEYLGGHRVRFVQPLQLYGLAAALFFLVNSIHPFFHYDPASGRVVSALSAAHIEGTVAAQVRAELAAHGVSPALIGERLGNMVDATLPPALIGAVLLFSALLVLLYRRTRRGYVEHVVFSLHWWAFALLLLTVDRLLPTGRATGAPGVALAALIAVVALGYLVVATRRVYGGSRLGSAGRGFVLWLGFYVTIALWSFGVEALAIVRLQQQASP